MTFSDIFASFVVFFFWFMAIWIFIAVFADIFRRRDLGGLAKAGWIVLIFVIPFVGALIYIIARPKTTEGDQQMIAAAQQRRIAGYSAADEIDKLSKLRDAGTLTPEEFEAAKARALAS
jgi:predicted membrane channel-forming protein YqfA (hemolysin III family)